MPAIGGEQHVLAAELIANGDGDGFLPDAEMHRALDLVGRVEADDLLLDAADAQELRVAAGEPGSGQHHRVVGRGGVGA